MVRWDLKCLLNCKFSAEYVGEKYLKMGQYLRQLSLKLRGLLLSGQTVVYSLWSSFSFQCKLEAVLLCIVSVVGDSFSNMKLHEFSTRDRDHDTDVNNNCAQIYKGGWWYTGCHRSNLNGLYLGGNHTSYADGIEWRTWTGYNYSLKISEMKIRPVGAYWAKLPLNISLHATARLG